MAITAWGQAADRQRVLEAGFDGHWVKSIDPCWALGLLKAIEPGGAPPSPLKSNDDGDSVGRRAGASPAGARKGSPRSGASHESVEDLTENSGHDGHGIAADAGSNAGFVMASPRSKDLTGSGSGASPWLEPRVPVSSLASLPHC